MSPREPRSPRPSALAGPPEGPPASHYPNTPAFTWQTLFIFFRKNRKTNVPSGLERTHGQHGEHMRAINTCVRSSPRPSRSPRSGPRRSRSPRSGVWTRPRCPHALCGSRGHSEPDPPTQGSQAVLQGGLRRRPPGCANPASPTATGLVSGADWAAAGPACCRASGLGRCLPPSCPPRAPACSALHGAGGALWGQRAPGFL